MGLSHMSNNEYTLKHQFVPNENNLKQKHYINN